MKRGDVWWAVLRDERRPVVVLTRDSAIPLLVRVAVAPLTRTIRGIPSEVVVDASDGLRERGVVSLDNIKTLSKRALVRRITALSESRMEQICEALNYSLGR